MDPIFFPWYGVLVGVDIAPVSKKMAVKSKIEYSMYNLLFSTNPLPKYSREEFILGKTVDWFYFYSSGLTCSDENARTKSHFAQEAARVGLAVVFPDTSPRGVDIEGKYTSK